MRKGYNGLLMHTLKSTHGSIDLNHFEAKILVMNAKKQLNMHTHLTESEKSLLAKLEDYLTDHPHLKLGLS